MFVLLDQGGIEREIVAQSGLPAAEKQAASRTLERAVRGVCGGQIAASDFYRRYPGYYLPCELTAFLNEEELDQYIERIDSETFEPAGDDQVRESLARLQKLADQAGIADEPWTTDASDEFGRAIEAALEAAGAGDQGPGARNQESGASQ